jgi:hypothetical protein
MSADDPKQTKHKSLRHTFYVENIQYGTHRRRGASTSRNGFCEQPFQLAQVSDLGADVVKMV